MATCNTDDIHDACNTYTCVNNGGTAECSAANAVTNNGGACDDGEAGTDPDTCTDGSCVGTSKKIFIVFRIKHLNW